MEQNWAEPLHEYAQFASIIRKLLTYRHQKHAQLEITQDALENKRANLDELERNEREASRLEEALGRGRVTGPHAQNSNDENAPRKNSAGSSEAGAATTADENADEEVDSADADLRDAPVYTPPHPATGPPPRRSGSGMGLLNALSYTLHGMMDVDPETARRNGISKTRETISQVGTMEWSRINR